MTNTYAINVTRGREFAVEAELQQLGVNVWLPRRLEGKWVKDPDAGYQCTYYDKPYISRLMFGVMPAVLYPDVAALKHILGKPMPLSDLDIRGPRGNDGLTTFKASVEAEYADMERKRANSQYECQFEAGQALMILKSAFEDYTASFQKVIKANGEVFLDIEIDVLGARRTVRVDPDVVEAA